MCAVSWCMGYSSVGFDRLVVFDCVFVVVQIFVVDVLVQVFILEVVVEVFLEIVVELVVEIIVLEVLEFFVFFFLGRTHGHGDRGVEEVCERGARLREAGT